MTDSKLDLWLDKHPKIDKPYTVVYLRYRQILRRVQYAFDFKAQKYYRQWKPGIAYLDHGYEPCILVTKIDDELRGVSMIDGREKWGCSIYHCGPELVSMKEARAIRDIIKKMQR